MRGQLVHAVAPQMRFVYLGSELRFNGLPSDPASRRSPCLWLRSAPPPPGGTFTHERLLMPGVPQERVRQLARSGVLESYQLDGWDKVFLLRDEVDGYLAWKEKEKG
jgi:hypothetical protein